MRDSTNKIFEFGPFRLDTAERVLLRDGQPVPLTLKAFDVLLLLVENSGHIVEKDELMNHVWAGSFVEEGNLKVTISMVRKALEDNHNGNRYVETVPRRGYRFLAEVKEISCEVASLVIRERTRETLTIEEEGIVKELPGMRPAPADRHLWNVTQHKLALAAVGVLILTVSTAAIFFAVKYLRSELTARDSVSPFSNFKITALTTSGRSGDAAISPDGKYVAYVVTDGAKHTLWMKHISTGSDTAISGPIDLLGRLTFSPNGDYLYYVTGDGKTSDALYQMPVFGGTPRKLISDIDSVVTFSPDSRQLAFLRGYPTQQKACVIVANSDGSGERTLVTHHLGDLFLAGPNHLGPAWSTDGETIVFGFTN